MKFSPDQYLAIVYSSHIYKTTIRLSLPPKMPMAKKLRPEDLLSNRIFDEQIFALKQWCLHGNQTPAQSSKQKHHLVFVHCAINWYKCKAKANKVFGPNS